MGSDIDTISELIDKLITVNIKLYNVLDLSGTLVNSALVTQLDQQAMNELAELNIKNIELVKMRSKLKTAIDNKINEAIAAGETDVLQEVKNYGG